MRCEGYLPRHKAIPKYVFHLRLRVQTDSLQHSLTDPPSPQLTHTNSQCVVMEHVCNHFHVAKVSCVLCVVVCVWLWGMDDITSVCCDGRFSSSKTYLIPSLFLLTQEALRIWSGRTVTYWTAIVFQLIQLMISPSLSFVLFADILNGVKKGKKSTFAPVT